MDFRADKPKYVTEMKKHGPLIAGHDLTSPHESPVVIKNRFRDIARRARIRLIQAANIFTLVKSAITPPRGARARHLPVRR
jgi:hypothetical protein